MDDQLRAVIYLFGLLGTLVLVGLWLAYEKGVRDASRRS